MTLYFISGLGADQRVFKKLHLLDAYKIVYLDWIVPLQNELICDYAKRLSQKINTLEPFCIIGLSFGGIIATELSHSIHPHKTILISSISNSVELPRYFKIFKFLPIYKLVSKKTLDRTPLFIYKLMGVKNKEDEKLFHTMLLDTNIVFFKWAISSILTWKQDKPVTNLYHIHGDADLIFPIKKTNPDYVISEGTHLMVYSNAVAVSSILSTILSR